MKNSSKINATAAVLLLGWAIVAVAGHFFGPQGVFSLNRHLTARSLGDQAASIWVVEYADFQCPACAKGAEFLETLHKEHPGKLYIQMRYFPLSNHSHALQSAVYAECASRQGRYWDFSERLFKQQREWAGLPEATSYFRQLGRSVGLDESRLDACVTDVQVEKLVLDEKKQAEGIGVSITPTYFVDGKMLAGFNAMKDQMKKYFPEIEPS